MKPSNGRTLAILFGSAAVLEALRYTVLASASFWWRFIPAHFVEGPCNTLATGGINCAGSVAAYGLLVPVLLLVRLPRDRWGLSFRRGDVKVLWLALLLVGAVLVGPAAMAAPSVRLYYPVFRYAGHHPALFAGWQGLQLAMLLGTEFFYRGPLLFSLADKLGRWPAAAVMVFPYMLSHVGSTPAEILASIPAGLLLGWLALRTGSILPGFALHACAAISVDVSSLVLRGQLGFLGIDAVFPAP